MLKLLTGGIDLPLLDEVVHLHSRELHDARGIMTLVVPYKSLAERLDAMDDRIASRALAEDVETLRLTLDRLKWDITGPFTAAGTPTLATDVADLQTANTTLAALVASLSKQVEALTAAKLSEVKARKAPRKDAAK
nr:hypothetical protein [Brevundimonas diminuta]